MKKEVLKQAFFGDTAGSAVSVISLIITLAITLVIAVYIFFAYRMLTRKTFYSKNFNVSLVGVSLITSAIIVTIQSSVVVSLGMVGALSIVRFRTAIKDPMDLMFLFWSISVGIICGAGFAVYAVALSVLMTVAIIVLNRLPIARAPMILIVNSSRLDNENEILQKVGEYAKHATVKSRNLTASALDLTIELRIVDGSDLVRELMAMNGVHTVSLLSHDGEVTF